MRCACVCIITLLLCYGLSCSIDKHRASIYKWFLFFEVMAIELHIDYNAMKYIYCMLHRRRLTWPLRLQSRSEASTAGEMTQVRFNVDPSWTYTSGPFKIWICGSANTTNKNYSATSQTNVYRALLYVLRPMTYNAKGDKRWAFMRGRLREVWRTSWILEHDRRSILLPHKLVCTSFSSFTSISLVLLVLLHFNLISSRTTGLHNSQNF